MLSYGKTQTCTGEGLYPAETGESSYQVTSKASDICEQSWLLMLRTALIYIPDISRGKGKKCDGEPGDGLQGKRSCRAL